MQRIILESMSINDITIAAEYAGNIAYYKSLSQFESLEAFNEHYRKLTYTYAELLDQKPSFKAILKVLFDSAPSTFGVPFMKRETLAEKAGVSVRSVANFLSIAKETFGITTLKQLGKKDKRYGGYAYLVYVFSPLSNLIYYPSEEGRKKSIKSPSEDTNCTAPCTASLHSVEKASTLQSQVIESPSEASNQDSFNQEYPSELKDINYIVQDSARKQSQNFEYISPFDKDVDMLLAGFDITEKIRIQKAIEKTLKKRDLLFLDVKLSVLKALETLKYFVKRANRGLFMFKKGITAFFMYNLNNEINTENEAREEAEYIETMREMYTKYDKESSNRRLDDFFERGVKNARYKDNPFAEYIAKMPITTERQCGKPRMQVDNSEGYGSSNDMPW
ncbi:hypothetical protein [Peribacillus asahii]|uniref:hypothetical protein n=1 Tax=Peribacillus asahii TaxID=228899 RepID=UPI00380F0E65